MTSVTLLSKLEKSLHSLKPTACPGKMVLGRIIYQSFCQGLFSLGELLASGMVLSLNEAIKIYKYTYIVDPAFGCQISGLPGLFLVGFFGAQKFQTGLRTGEFDSGGHSKTVLFPPLESHKNLGTIESNRIANSRQTRGPSNN